MIVQDKSGHEVVEVPPSQVNTLDMFHDDFLVEIKKEIQ